MTAAATATTRTNYQLTTTNYEPKKNTQVELNNGPTLMFYSKGVPVTLYIQQHTPLNPAVFHHMYEIIPDMPKVLLSLIGEYLSFSFFADPSHFPALTRNMQQITKVESTAVMAVMPPSNEEQDLGVMHSTPGSTSYDIFVQSALMQAGPTVTIIPDTLYEGKRVLQSGICVHSLFHSSIAALQQHPLGGEIDYLITPRNNENPKTKKSNLVHLMIFQPPADFKMPETDESFHAIMAERSEKHAKASAIMAEIHNNPQKAVVKEAS